MIYNWLQKQSCTYTSNLIGTSASDFAFFSCNVYIDVTEKTGTSLVHVKKLNRALIMTS